MCGWSGSIYRAEVDGGELRAEHAAEKTEGGDEGVVRGAVGGESAEVACSWVPGGVVL